MAQPVLVHLVFHPQSNKARALARSIHRTLNDDPAVPGLHVPTAFPAEDGTGLPPVHDRFDEAERVFVAVLADDDLALEPDAPPPADRTTWSEYVADLWEACQGNPNRRCVPFQLSEYAWPLNDRLAGVSFPRAFAVADEDRARWVQSRLVVELVRFLLDKQAGNEDATAPVTIFLSHTKRDLERDPKVVETLTKFFTDDKPVELWFDSGDIEGGSVFGKKIEAGIRNAALLAVLTDSYASREWCRKEVLLAKQHKRPMVVVDALQEREVRAFPYAGNVPVLRWQGHSRDALDLLLKEALRQLHVGRELEGIDGDQILSSAPELVTVVGLPKGTRVLYPDPPLGKNEQEILARSGVVAETPLQRLAQSRLLSGLHVALSLSESGDQARYGKDLLHLNQAAAEIARYLAVAGATLYYGGLPGTGYTEVFYEMLRSYPVAGVPELERIIHHVGWPIPLSKAQQVRVQQYLKARRMKRPEGLAESDHADFVAPYVTTFFPAKKSGLHRYAWGRGMTAMREAQISETHARVALGGKFGPTITATLEGEREEKWYSSRIPGVLEEILLSLKAKQPLYLLGGFGGCARLAADVLSGLPRDEMTWEAQQNAPCAEAMRRIYKERGEWWSYDEMTAWLQAEGLAGLRNGLTPDENETLFKSTDLAVIVPLVLKGLQSLEHPS